MRALLQHNTPVTRAQSLSRSPAAVHYRSTSAIHHCQDDAVCSTSAPAAWAAVARPSSSPRRRVACRASSVEEKQTTVKEEAAYGGGYQTPTTSDSDDNASADDAPYDGIIAEEPVRPPGLQVRVRNMVKHFNTVKGVFRAVDGVDVDVAPSSIVALLGPSGSGKTTLLRLVAGLETPTGGRIYFDDEDATDLPVQDRQIGFVFQSYALFGHKTVAENIKFGLEVRKLKVDHNQRVADLLDLVQLANLADRFPRQLSGGQRQRVALARALASNPRLLLLDEPFGALDAVVRRQLRAGLKEIVRSVGVTTIIVTHDQEEAFDLADHVVIFNRGLIEQQGSPTEIIKHPKTPFIMKFVGETSVVPANCQLIRRSKFSTTKDYVMFRPHDIKLFKTPPQDDVLVTTPATVIDRLNLGWVIKYIVKFDDNVVAEIPVSRDQDESQYNLNLGSRVFLHVKPQAMMGFNYDEIDSAPVTK